MIRPYHGRDRRGTISAEALSPRAFALAAATVVAAAVADAAGLELLPPAVLGGIAAGLGLAAAGVCWLRWWELGDAAGLWLAGALLPTAAALVAPEAAAAGHVAGAASVVVAALVPEVDARQRRWWLVAVPSAAAAGLLALPLPAGVATLAWLAAVVALTVRGARGRLRLLWFALMAAALAATGVAGSGVVAVAGFGAVLLGLLLGVRSAIGVQRDHLFEAAVATLRAQARIDAAAHERERVAHDIHNALTALSGAALTLDRHRDRLDEATREALSDGMRHELQRLHDLLAGDSAEGVTAFSVASAMRPLQADPVATHDWDVPDVVAYGRAGDTAHAVRLLLGRAPGGGSVTASRAGAEVRLEVRGVSASGLALEVVAALMAAQGGGVEPLDPAAGRREGYVLSLPAAS